jgi:hypothetical protein
VLQADGQDLGVFDAILTRFAALVGNLRVTNEDGDWFHVKFYLKEMPSVLIEDVELSTFVMATHDTRIHIARATDFYEGLEASEI